MSNFKGFRSGKKLPKKDVQRRVEAYNKKIEEYDKLPLEELKVLKSTLKGSYKLACEQVEFKKMMIEANTVEVKDTEAEETKTSLEVNDDMVTTAGGDLAEDINEEELNNNFGTP